MKNMMRYLIILVLFSILMISACSQHASNSQPSAAKAPASQAPAATQATQGIIKIGHIRPLTGNAALEAQMMVKSFDFAFQQVGYQVAGKQIQIVVGDSLNQVGPAVDVAKKMVQNDKVALIVGPMAAGEIMGVANYVNQVGIPQLATNPATSATLDTKLPWTISLGGIPAQYSSAMGAYAYEQLGFKKVDVMTGDWADGHEFLNAFMAKFKSDGGQIVQEQYTPEPTQDYSAYLSTLKDADAVVSWYPGGEAIKFLIQYHEMNIDKRMPVLAAFNGAFMAPFIIAALPPADSAALMGAYLPSVYTPLLDNPLNKQFVSDYQAKFGSVPDDSIESSYVAGLAIIQALKANGGDSSPDKLRQALLAVNLDTPQGPVKVDPQNRGAIYSMYICKLGKQGNEYIYQPVYTYKDVPSTGIK